MTDKKATTIREADRQLKQAKTLEQEEKFLTHLGRLEQWEVEDPDTLRDIFLGIYSNPVDNCYKG